MWRTIVCVKRLRRQLRRDEDGATALEWTLLLAVVVLPSYVLIRVSLALLVVHYRMIVMLNGLPLP